MTYRLFEIPSERSGHADVVWADPDSSDRSAYTHIAYAIEATDNEDSVIKQRGIRFKSLRHWTKLSEKFPTLLSRLNENRSYYAGESVLEADELNPSYNVQPLNHEQRPVKASIAAYRCAI